MLRGMKDWWSGRRASASSGRFNMAADHPGRDSGSHRRPDPYRELSEMAYQAKIVFSITKDNQPFFENVSQFDNMDYENVVELEKFGNDTLASLQRQFGEERGKRKGKIK